MFFISCDDYSIQEKEFYHLEIMYRQTEE